jgi:CHAD domain-containing protein
LHSCADADVNSADPLSVIAERLPIAPGKYPRWVIPQSARPGAQTRTDIVVQRQLAYYAEIMALNIDGMRRGLDSEFLHQFRIGLTHSRALLRNAPGIFAAGRIRPHAEFLKQLAGETGFARDAQVHALVFPDYVAALPAEERRGLQALLALVNSEQQRTQHALAAMLASSQFRRRWQAWLRFVHADALRISRQVLGAQPIAVVAPQLLAKRARRIERKGRKINAKSPPEAYHELRKDCKKLRYLIDAYGLYVRKAMPSRTIKRLKALQDLLGEYQDLDVHQAALLDLQRRLQQQGLLSVEAQQAIGALLKMLCQRAGRLRDRFPQDFSAFRTLRLARSLRNVGG